MAGIKDVFLTKEFLEKLIGRWKSPKS